MRSDIGSVIFVAMPRENVAAPDFSNTGFMLRQVGFFLTMLLFCTSVLAANYDLDSDGILDMQDNCIYQPNGPLIPDAGGNVQLDTDADDYGNICDGDFDNDGAVGFPDLGYMKSVFFTADAEGDLDGDGAVGFPDLGLLKSMFFKPPPLRSIHFAVFSWLLASAWPRRSSSSRAIRFVIVSFRTPPRCVLLSASLRSSSASS